VGVLILVEVLCDNLVCALAVFSLGKCILPIKFVLRESLLAPTSPPRLYRDR